MATREGKTLTEQRIRKEKALAGLRELQLRQAEGKRSKWSKRGPAPSSS